MKLRVIALAVAVLSSSVFAASPTTPADKPAAKDSPDELVCTYEQSTGSHLGHRVCATRAAREERAKEDQRAM